ncbi:IclR family transcriptional regulator [Pseudomonas japonica]|uniref:Transcriptional regulator, IclR family n=1 Tax=Pseudomonas japonica TaxID=256466 RepID=A0A239JI67_9PSED|nr:IclR family transcriptional regulator [Pseudomonas japonica]SNT05272.1 transcriptional regulator, IclR family [Pseudomonas japonica]
MLNPEISSMESVDSQIQGALASADDANARKSGRDNGIQVIARAAAILNALSADPEGLSLGQIATKVALARSTVQRIVQALETEGLVTAGRKGVKLGPALARLGSIARMDVKSLAHPHMKALSNEINETVDLSMLVDNQLLFIDQIVSDRKLRIVSAVGALFPLYCTAHGKAYLATLSDKEVRQIIAGKIRRHTLHTVTDVTALIEQLHAVRRTGFGYDLEEHTEDISAVGTVLEDVSGLHYTLSITVPAARFMRNKDQLTEALGRCRNAIQETLIKARS